MPKAGQVLYHKSFVFTDGDKSNKLLVVLNTNKNNEACLVVKTTSQPKHYPRALPGCNSGKCIFYILEECEQGFPTDTYVQIDHVYEINVESLLNSKQVTFVDHMTDACFKQLKKCLRNSREDIPLRFWQIIYSGN
jgi:hypothetical protein